MNKFEKKELFPKYVYSVNLDANSGKNPIQVHSAGTGMQCVNKKEYWQFIKITNKFNKWSNFLNKIIWYMVKMKESNYRFLKNIDAFLNLYEGLFQEINKRPDILCYLETALRMEGLKINDFQNLTSIFHCYKTFKEDQKAQLNGCGR